MTEKSEALRLADRLEANFIRTQTELDTAAELLRLHDENETLRQQRDEIFGALVQISLLTHLGGEVAEYGDVVDAVRRLHAVNAELLEALKRIKETRVFVGAIAQEMMDAAIARAEGEKT
jgi:hypothetical protein